MPRARLPMQRAGSCWWKRRPSAIWWWCDFAIPAKASQIRIFSSSRFNRARIPWAWGFTFRGRSCARLGDSCATSASPAGFWGRVLIVTAWSSDTEARRRLRQGVSGMFVKESSLEELAGAIHTVAEGGMWLDARYRVQPDEDAAEDARPQFNERQRK